MRKLPLNNSREWVHNAPENIVAHFKNELLIKATRTNDRYGKVRLLHKNKQ